MPKDGQKLSCWAGTWVDWLRQKGGFLLLPEIQNWVFRAIPLFSFLRVGGVGEIGPMKFPSLYRGKQGFQ